MNRIATLRKEHGLSQAQLGKLMGVAQNTISNWEHGKREPDYVELKKLAYHLDCSVDYLMGTSPLGHTFVFSQLERTDSPERPLEKLSTDELRALIEQLYEILEKVVDDSPHSRISIDSGALLLHYFRMLNCNGKAEAIKRIKELTSLMEYITNSEKTH